MSGETKNLPEEMLVGENQRDLSDAGPEIPDIVIEEGFKSSRGTEKVGDKGVEGPLLDHSREYDAEMDKVAKYTERERTINKKLFGRESPGVEGEQKWCIFDELKQVKTRNEMLREAAEKLLQIKKTGDSKTARLIGRLLGKGRDLGSFSEELKKAQADFDRLKIQVEEGRNTLRKQFREVDDLVIKEQMTDEDKKSSKDSKSQRMYNYGNFIRSLESDIPTTNPTHEELTVEGFRKEPSIDKLAATGSGETSDVFDENYDPDATVYRDLHNQGFQFEDSNNFNPDTKRYDVYIKEGEHTASLKPAFEANTNLEELVKDVRDRLNSDKEMSTVSEVDKKQLEELANKAYDEKERLKKELGEDLPDKEGKRLKENMIEDIEKTLQRWEGVMQVLDVREQEKN